MLKKWKKTIQILATTIIVLIYVTIGLFNSNSQTLKGEEKKKKPLSFILDSSTTFTTDKYWGNVKTVVGYSREFQIREELQGRIECEPRVYPNDKTDDENVFSKWRHARKLGIKIFSAYYDRREREYHHVRIIALLPRNSSFYCQIWYENNETMTFVTQKAIIHEIWSADWGPKNKTCDDEYPAIISCLTPSQSEIGAIIPTWVSFVDKTCNGDGTFVRITPPPERTKKRDFVVCVKPLHLNKLRKKTFLDWLDINHHLGAEEIVIYGSDIKEIDSVLHSYKRRQIVVRKEFEPPLSRLCPSRSFEEYIWYKRKLEIIAYNDCFYSNLYHAKFVIPLDLDEIIVPKTGNNWFEAFRSHFLNAKLQQETKDFWPEDTEHYASFSVRNAYFFSQYPKDAIIRGLMLPKRDLNVPKKLVNAFRQNKLSSREENIFDRTIRSCHLSPKSDSVKSFVQVSKTLSLFNHFAFHVLGEATRQLIFPETVFQLNHYRDSCDPVLIDGCREFLNCVIYDNSLNKFRKRNVSDFNKNNFNLDELLSKVSF